MWNSGVNTNFAKCFILFMAIVILLQGCAYLGLATTGLILRQQSNSTYNLEESPFQVIFTLLYFPHEESITLTKQNNDLEKVNLTVSDPHGLAQRTYILLLTYAVVSSLWIITSLLVMVSLYIPITKIIIGISFAPWLTCIIIGSIIDIISTGFYASDIFHTTDSGKIVEYLHLKLNNSNKAVENDAIKRLLENFDPYFVIPAVIMTCITSRLILIWFLNIIGSSFCLSLARVLSQRNVSPVKSKTTVENGHATIAVASTQTMLDQSTQYDKQHREQPTIPDHIRQSPQQQTDIIEQPKLKYLQHVANISRQPSTKSSTQPSVTSSTQLFVNNVEETNSNQMNANMLQQMSLHNTRFVANSAESYHNNNTHNINNNNHNNSNPHHNSYCQCCLHVNDEMRHGNDHSNYRNHSTAANVSEELRNNNHPRNSINHSNIHITEDLRNHLPWSYTEMRPRLSFIQPHSYPEIPPADYNRH